jgi:hypothetical protein
VAYLGVIESIVKSVNTLVYVHIIMKNVGFIFSIALEVGGEPTALFVQI